MARDFNQIRNTNAKLVNATIDKYGASYPAQSPWRADGFNKVFVETESANPTQKDFLEGNSSVYVYAIGSNIGSLLPYSLASFTNIKELYLFSPTMVNIGAIDNDYLTYLTQSDLKVYVPSNTLQNYINTYGGTGKHLENRFDEITDGYPLTVSGSGDLTSRELTNQLMNKYESVDRTNCTKLVIQGFTNVSSVIWGYDFSKILPNLESILVNGVKFDFSVLNIVGSGTLTEIDIDNAISDIAISNRGGVLEVKISGYSDMSVALEYNYEDLPNLEYIWLDNVRYDIDNLPRLPSAYQEVEYIESTGTQYIDTNVLTNSSLEIDTTMQISQVSTDYNMCLFGSWYNQYAFRLIRQTSGEVGAQKKSSYYALNTDLTSKHYIEFNKNNNIYIDGVLVENMNDEQFSSLLNVNVFIGYSRDINRLEWVNNGKTKLWDMKIYDNSIIVRNLIPCYRTNDNVIGLYDLTNNTFYTNSGTGTFLKGNDTRNPTYFYPLTDLEQEYDANLNQTFYLDYNGTLPSYPNYQLTYYSDINCTTSILPENMQSGTIYYVKAVMVTLVIQGSGTLTSAIVEEQVAKAGSGVTKVVVENTYTTISQNDYDYFWNSIKNNLSNVDTVAIPFTLNTRDGGITVSMSQIKTLIQNKEGNVECGYFAWTELFSNLETLSFPNATSVILQRGNNNLIINLDMPNVTSLGQWSQGFNLYFKNPTAKIIELPEVTYFDFGLASRYANVLSIKLPKVTTIKNIYSYQVDDLYIGTSNCQLTGSIIGYSSDTGLKHIYIPRGSLSYYQNATNWSNYADKFVEIDY